MINHIGFKEIIRFKTYKEPKTTKNKTLREKRKFASTEKESLPSEEKQDGSDSMSLKSFEKGFAYQRIGTKLEDNNIDN